jgi:molybdopterin converting factor small subunit
LVIQVRLHSIFRLQTPEGPQSKVEMDLPEGATVALVVRELDLIDKTDGMLMVVNRRIAELDQALVEGDEVRLMPVISGGAEELHGI